MTPNTTHTPESRPATWGPAFDTAPGLWLVGNRALWELGKWMVSHDYRLASLLIFFFVPGGSAGVFTGGFLSILYGALLLERLSKTRAGTCLAMLPIPSRQMTRFLWAMTIMFCPLVYGVVQLLVRVGMVLAGVGSWGWVGQILPECIIAMGLATLIPLGRTIAPREVPPSARTFGQVSIRDLVSTFAFLAAFVAGWVLIRSEGILHFAYAGSFCLATVLVAMSYCFANRFVSADLLIHRRTTWQSPAVNWHLSPLRKPRASTFFDLWLSHLVYGSSCVLAVVVWIPAYLYLLVVEINSELPAGVVIIPWALLQTYVFRWNDFDYRVIRSLPLRRSHQALLILSFVLPLLLPTSIAVFGAAPYMGWPLLNAVGFLVAFGGCCAVAVALGSIFGYVPGGMIGGIAVAPVALTFWYWHSPWALVLYALFGVALWLASYAYLYQQLCGDGALYGKRDVIADVVAGRE